MTSGAPVLYEIDGGWMVAVLNGNKLQEFRCPTLEKARAFMALFSKPPRAMPVRVQRKRRVQLPAVLVRAMAWG